MPEVSEQNLVRFAEIAYSIDSHLGAGSYIDDVVAAVPDSGRRFDTADDIRSAIAELLSLLAETEAGQCRADMALTLRSALALLAFKSRLSSNTTDLESDLTQLYDRAAWRVEDDQIKLIRSRRATVLPDAPSADHESDKLDHWRKKNLVKADEFAASLADQYQRFKLHACRDYAPLLLGGTRARRLIDRLDVAVSVSHTEDNWQAYCHYERNGRGRVEINARHSFSRHAAPLFITHEMFPGHFFEAAIREELITAGELSPFYAFNLLFSPRSLLSEGIAEYGFVMMDRHLSDDERAASWDEKLFTDIRNNIALDMVERDWTLAEAAQCLANATGATIERCTMALEFANKWSRYFPIYSNGFYEVDRYLASGSPADWHRIYLYSSLR